GRWRADGRLVLGAPAVTLARIGDGARIVVATTDWRPGGGGNLGNHFVQDQLLFVDVRAMRVVEQRLTARRTERQMRAGDVDRGCSPMGIAEAGDGSLLVAFAGSDEVWGLPRGSIPPRIVSL